MLFEAFPDALLLVDGEDRVVRASQRAARLFGRSSESLRGMSVAALLAPRTLAEHGPRLHRDLAERQAELAGRGLRAAIIRPDGVEIETEQLAVELPDLGLLLVVYRRVPDTFEANPERPLAEGTTGPTERITHRLVFESAPLGIFHFDARGVITACNQAFARILGSSRQLLVGLDLLTLPDAAIRSSVRAVLSARKAYYEGEYRAVTSGKVTPVRVDFAPVCTEDGEVLGGVGIVEDVTERREVEQALRRSEATFRLLTESSPDGIGVLVEGEFVYLNPGLRRLLAVEGPPQPGAASLLLEPEEARQLQRSLSEPTRRQAAPPRERRLQLADGSERVLEVTVLPIDYDGTPALLVQARDVTERRELERKLAHADRMASVGTLAAGVAHEINNPLAVLVGNLGLVQAAARRLESPADRERLREPLETMQQATDRVRQIVRDLTTFSRPQAEVRVPVDVEQVLDATVSLAWNEIRHRARLVRRYGGVGLVEADESRLGQVFLNLLVNAVQAIPEGRPGEAEIRLVTRQEPGWVVVEVEDTGTGLPADAGRLFEPFYTTKPLGTGLGLSICHGIVQSFGGSIHAQRLPEGGARFRVELPALASSAPPAPTPPATQAFQPSGRTSRILVIDDEPLLGRTLRIAFQGVHDVVVVESGREALVRLEEDRAFDLVLCDLMMPDVSGTQVYAEVQRATPELASRFAFMSGGAFTEASRAFLESWRGLYLEKPFDIHDVERLLMELESRPRGSAEP